MNALFAIFLALVCLGAPILAWAQAAALPSNLGVYVWLGAFAVLGGLVNFARKVKAGTSRWLNINELIGEIVTSGFVGVVTGLLLTAVNAPAALTFAAAGVTGHMGGRAIFWLEQAAQKLVESKFGIKVDDPEATTPGAK